MSTVAQLKRLIGNPNAYAMQNTDGTWYPIEQAPDAEEFQRHLKHLDTMGTYILWNDKARTLVFDIDTEPLDTAHEQAIEVTDALDALGVPERSYGIEFSGRKGYHVWLVLANYVPAKQLRRLGRYVLALSGIKCEVFPKQDRAAKLGNLVKLPCGIHQVTEKENNFVTTFPQPLGLGVFNRILRALPEEPKPSFAKSPETLRCLACAQRGVGKGERNNAMFQLATWLRRGGLLPEWIDRIVRESAAKCDPPMPDSAVTKLLQSAATSGPICSQLSDDLKCPDCPILRGRGLALKAGQVRHGADGELAVIELGPKRGPLARELVHPDLAQAISRLS